MTADGTADFIRAAHALNEAGDRELRKGVYRGFRSAARPLGESMVQALAGDMPKRGGLSARVANSKVSIRNATTGSNPRVAITVRGPKGAMAVGAMNAGNLRHPVFGRKTWVSQHVPAGAATRAFEEGAPAVRRIIVRDLNAVIAETAKKGSS